MNIYVKPFLEGFSHLLDIFLKKLAEKSKMRVHESSICAIMVL